MTASEEIKLQAKLLEWQAPKYATNLRCYKYTGSTWLTDGIVVAKIPVDVFMLDVSEHNGIKDYTVLPGSAVKAWLTPTQWKDKELGVCVRAETATEGVWVRDKYLKLFGKNEYSFYMCEGHKCLWLTEPKTRNVVGVIAGVRGIKV